MDEIESAILEGVICEMCACLVDGEEPGFPRICEDCEEMMTSW